MTHLDNANQQELVRIGENGIPLSIKDYQNIYHQITSRTESINKVYEDHVMLTFDDIENLHHKIKQVLSIHHVIAENELITVYFIKDRKEQYSSLDRFLIYNSSFTSPILNINLTYNFALLIPDIEKPQHYKITITIWSRVALLKKMEQDEFYIPSFFRYNAASQTIQARVEYVDYVVARTFIEGVDEWVGGCKKNKINSVMKFFKLHSGIVSPIFSVLIGLSVIVFAYLKINIDNFDVSSNVDLLRFCLVYIGGFICITPIAKYCGQYIEDMIDAYQPLSYLSLNKGDENLIQETKNSKKLTAVKLILRIFLTVMLGYISSRLSLIL